MCVCVYVCVCVCVVHHTKFFCAFQGWVTALCCAGSSVFSASADKTVVCWDAASRAPLHVQCDHSSYVKALLLCKWQLWSLSKDSLHITAADGVFSSLEQHLQLSQSECRAMSTAVVSLGSRIEELKQQIQVCCCTALAAYFVHPTWNFQVILSQSFP